MRTCTESLLFSSIQIQASSSFIELLQSFVSRFLRVLDRSCWRCVVVDGFRRNRTAWRRRSPDADFRYVLGVLLFFELLLSFCYAPMKKIERSFQSADLWIVRSCIKNVVLLNFLYRILVTVMRSERWRWIFRELSDKKSQWEWCCCELCEGLEWIPLVNIGRRW